MTARPLRRLQPIMSAVAGGPKPAATMAASDAGGSGADLRYVSPPSSDAADFNARPLQYPIKLYPKIEPYSTGFLDAGFGHQVRIDPTPTPTPSIAGPDFKIFYPLPGLL